MGQELLTTIQPVLLEFIVAVFGIIGAVLLRRIAGINLSDKRQHDFRSGIRTILLAVANRDLSMETLIGVVRDYMRQANPEALAFFNPSDDILRTIIAATQEQIARETIPPLLPLDDGASALAAVGAASGIAVSVPGVSGGSLVGSVPPRTGKK